MPIQAFIFDLDGVLADTPMLHYHSWKRLAEDEGLIFSWDQHVAMQGLHRRESLDVFLGGRPVTETQAAEMMMRKNGYFLELLEQLSPTDCFPGTEAFIRAARAAGLKLALASSSQNAKQVLFKLGLTPLFDVIGDGNTVSRNKPAPDIFLWAAEQLRVKPAEALVFEDSEAGLRAALDGGFWVVGVHGKHGQGAHLELAALEGQTPLGIIEQLRAPQQN